MKATLTTEYYTSAPPPPNISEGQMMTVAEIVFDYLTLL